MSKKHLWLLVFTGLLLTVGPSPAFADPVSPGDDIMINWGTPQSSVNGGPFILTWRKTDGTTGSFETFCVERGETVGIGTWYDVHSVGSTILLATGSSNPPSQALTAEVAWLYWMYRTNRSALTGWADDVAHVNALQLLIWEYQGYGSAGNDSIVSGLRNLANGLSDEQKQGALAHVQVINPISGLTHRQSQLMLVPEPGTLLLAGIGLLAAAAIRSSRRR